MMHSSNYRPSKSNSLYIADLFKRENPAYMKHDVIVHHVLEDSPRRLYCQLEIRNKQHTTKMMKPTFVRFEIEGD